jgi:hypothetical protein
MCCGDPPPPPDLGPMAEASAEVGRMAQQTSREQLAWAREQDTMNRNTLNTVLGVQLPAMQDQFENAREDRSRWEEMFRPLEDQFVAEAQGYDTEARREREMGGAVADVGSAFDAQRRNALQRLESYGVDPSQTRNAALDIGVRTAQAAASAGAATGARNRVEDVGRALRSDAINMGRGALSGVAGSYGGAVGAGSSAIGGANQTTGTSSNAINSSSAWGGQALQGFGQSSSIMNSGFQNEMDRFNAETAQTTGMLQGIGGIAGMAMGMADGGEAVDTGTGNGSGIDDTVPAMLSDGEYVIPADVVRIKGEEFFDRIVEKYHTPAAQQRQAIGA